MLQENIYKDWWGQQSAMEASNQQKYIPSYLPGYGEFENLCFVSVAWTVSGLRAFVYNAVDEKHNLYRFLGKTATVDKCTVNLRITSVAHLTGQSLVNILSQIPAL